MLLWGKVDSFLISMLLMTCGYWSTCLRASVLAILMRLEHGLMLFVLDMTGFGWHNSLLVSYTWLSPVTANCVLLTWRHIWCWLEQCRLICLTYQPLCNCLCFLVLCWLESIAFKVTTLQQYRNEFIRPLSLDIVGDCFMFSGCLSVSFVRFFRPDLFPQSHEWLEQYRHIHREYSLMTWLDSGGQRSRSQQGSSYSCHYDYQYLACSAPRYAELTVAW